MHLYLTLQNLKDCSVADNEDTTIYITENDDSG